MKKGASTVKSGAGDLFETAGQVFSKGLVDMIRSQGRDFLESDPEGPFTSDAEGHRLLDCYTSAGTFNLGRRNPAVTAALKKAIFETDQGNFVMPSEEKAILAKRISGFVPANLDCVLFGVTRGESMDAAAKLARGFTGRSGLVTVDGGFYGETGFALSLSERKGKERFGRLIPDVKVVPFGDIGALRAAAGSNTAAFVMEPIQAENNCRMTDAHYYSEIRTLCDRHGIKLIFDETQTGFGRTGHKFFFEHLHVVPDILIVGEAITGGVFPMTAMVFTPELKGFFDAHPLIHLCTFGGHDLGCRAAMAALDEYDRNAPWDNARDIGQRLMSDLVEITGKKGKAVRSVAGKGLLLSLQLGSADEARTFCIRARDNGLLVAPGRVDESCVLLRPSLLITQKEGDLIAGSVAKTIDML